MHSKIQKPRILRDKTTREYFFVINGGSYPIDAANLASTLGHGMYDGKGLVDSWSDAAWCAVLGYLGLPLVPLVRTRAQWVVKRFVQKLWIEAFEPIDEAAQARMAARDAAACKKYAEEFGAIADGAKFAAAGGRSSTRKTAVHASYAPTAELKKQKVSGQARALLNFFKKTQFAPATTTQAADGMVAAGLKTSTKPARIAAFYLCDWVKKGWLVRRPCFA